MGFGGRMRDQSNVLQRAGILPKFGNKTPRSSRQKWSEKKLCVTARCYFIGWVKGNIKLHDGTDIVPLSLISWVAEIDYNVNA
jgi:hypothetical protein